MIDGLIIDRPLKVSDPADRMRLREAASSLPSLNALVEEHLADYVRLFPEEFWLTVSPGGVVFIPTAKRSVGVADIPAATEKVRNLLRDPAYRNTPWVGLWTFWRPVAAVWRQDQPFDGSLAEPRVQDSGPE